MKNTLSDLNNHLFAQLERLSDEELKDDQLSREILRAKSINGIAKNIIDNAKTTLEGAQFAVDRLPKDQPLPDQFKLKAE